MVKIATLRGDVHYSIQHKLQNSMEVDSVVITALLSMSYITTRIVKTQTSVAKIPRVPVENQITTLSVVKIPTKFSLCIHFFLSAVFFLFFDLNTFLKRRFRKTIKNCTLNLQKFFYSANRMLFDPSRFFTSDT